jgi:hypothetical protein
MGEADVKHGPDGRLAASMASVSTIPKVISAAYDVRVRTSLNGSHTVIEPATSRPPRAYDRSVRKQKVLFPGCS